MRIIVFQHELVDINLADTACDTALGNFVRESISAVQDDADAACDLFADGFESVRFMRVSKKRSISPRVIEDSIKGAYRG